MSFQTPVAKCTAEIPTLGQLWGLQFANGVQQYCGIPYADLPKRWTRSTLKTAWENSKHDGTKLGKDCPRPYSDGDDTDDLVPVPPPSHFPDPPETDELSALVMNIVIPFVPTSNGPKVPVMVYVHGGSLLYGGANLPIFDAVNLVSQSIEMGMPIICVNFNYRVGLGGFLASEAIRCELQEDGFQGCGNFGFTDQQLAFEWVQRHIKALGGDPGNVTAVGESAGGISISNQLAAAHPPTFRRAVAMSGLSVSIPPWDMNQHEALFQAVCRYFQIDASRPDVLDRLRHIPQQDLANATPAIQGVLSGTGNPCLDGWFYKADPCEIQAAPAWLEALMLGDTYHEGIIFHMNLLDDDYLSIRRTLLDSIHDESETDRILTEYGINSSLPHGMLLERVEHMCGDAVFKIPNYATALENSTLQDNGGLFLYHFDQRSRLKNALEGTAYHAHELLYLFKNMTNEMSDEENKMAEDFAGAWIKLCNGATPWTASKGKWKVWGPNSAQAVKDEEEDEESRFYQRMQRIRAMGGGGTWKRWLAGVDALVNKRMNLGKAV
ncbi:acetylcholinesterase [Aspergillus ibericus CBS 121593]|uniref:Acetylcholinesterase n=1 Tax=Aspergillus ibericus CBS 121593 TaxID=1448316 RepID=A0A395GMR2_9EURO|nr:acetylcholinesterase [Aspergillus ibericus CBS 121593]RAK95303.1 acetylcholinesterase [Aspergillus ibericus CBS 121593]